MESLPFDSVLGRGVGPRMTQVSSAGGQGGKTPRRERRQGRWGLSEPAGVTEHLYVLV